MSDFNEPLERQTMNGIQRKALLSVFIALATTPVFAQFCTPDTGSEAAAAQSWFTVPVAEGVFLVYSPEAQARMVGLPWLISNTDGRRQGLPSIRNDADNRRQALPSIRNGVDDRGPETR